ncbi:MAG: hypothetical protein E6Z15_01520 [Paenibacillus macerans]|nr:hypothetical protein [Paenibacillus macerans]
MMIRENSGIKCLYVSQMDGYCRNNAIFCPYVFEAVFRSSFSKQFIKADSKSNLFGRLPRHNTKEHRRFIGGLLFDVQRRPARLWPFGPSGQVPWH